MLNGNSDVGQDGTVGMKVKAEGNAKFFKVVMPERIIAPEKNCLDSQGTDPSSGVVVVGFGAAGC